MALHLKLPQLSQKVMSGLLDSPSTTKKSFFKITAVDFEDNTSSSNLFSPGSTQYLKKKTPSVSAFNQYNQLSQQKSKEDDMMTKSWIIEKLDQKSDNIINSYKKEALPLGNDDFQSDEQTAKFHQERRRRMINESKLISQKLMSQSNQDICRENNESYSDLKTDTSTSEIFESPVKKRSNKKQNIFIIPSFGTNIPPQDVNLSRRLLTQSSIPTGALMNHQSPQSSSSTPLVSVKDLLRKKEFLPQTSEQESTNNNANPSKFIQSWSSRKNLTNNSSFQNIPLEKDLQESSTSRNLANPSSSFVFLRQAIPLPQNQQSRQKIILPSIQKGILKKFDSVDMNKVPKKQVSFKPIVIAY